jgi:hypothetical protein
MEKERELRLSTEALCALLRKAGLAGEDETVKRIRIESGKLIIELVK